VWGFLELQVSNLEELAQSGKGSRTRGEVKRFHDRRKEKAGLKDKADRSKRKPASTEKKKIKTGGNTGATKNDVPCLTSKTR